MMSMTLSALVLVVVKLVSRGKWTSFLVDRETASSGLLAVLGDDLRQFTLESSSVKAAGGECLVTDLEGTSGKRVDVACSQVSFKLIRDALNECVKFFAHALVLLQFSDLGYDF